MLSAQNSSLALTNRQEASIMAQTVPDFNDCCVVDDFLLQINFERPISVLEECSVIPGEALLFYPSDGANGDAVVCVSFPNVGAFNLGDFELYDIGDFTESTLNGNTLELCRTVSYPVLNNDGDDIGFIRSRFFVVPRNSATSGLPFVRNIQGSVAVEADNLECSCDEPIQFGFTLNSTFGIGSGQNTPPNGADLSSLLDQNCAFCLPPLDNPNTTDRVYLTGGGLNIDVDYKLGRGNNAPLSLILGPDFKINVKSGTTLELVNVQVAGCRTMWDAITVEDGGRLIINPGINSFGQRISSRVSDGERGIVIENGGRIDADNATFEENYLGITTLSNANRKSVEVNIFGSEFLFGTGVAEENITIAPFLLRPHFGETPRAGIELYDVEEGFIVDFGISAGRPSRFENLENGIIFNKSSGYVSGTIFSWLTTTHNPESGNGILIKDDGLSRNKDFVYVEGNPDHPSGGVSFRNSARGINALDPYSLRVRNAEFSNLDYGVLADNPSRLRVYDSSLDTWVSGVTAHRRRPGSTTIRDNHFLARSRNAEGNGSSAVRLAGITDFFSERASINDNVFQLDGVAVGVHITDQVRLEMKNNDIHWDTEVIKTRGVIVEGRTRAQLSGNFVLGDGTLKSTGFEFNTASSVDLHCNRMENMLLGTQFSGNNALSRVRGNVMKNLKTGLTVGASSTSGVFNSIGRQVHTGNSWFGNFDADSGARYLGNEFDLTISQFVVDNDEPGFIPPSWFPIGSEFIRIQFNSPITHYTCPAGLPPGDNFTGDDDYIRKLLNGQISWSDKLGASEWIAKNQLFDSYERGFVHATVPGLANWGNNSNQDTIRDTRETATAISAVLSPVDHDNQQIEELADSLGAAHENYAKLTIQSQRAAFAEIAFSELQLKAAKNELSIQRLALENMVSDPASGLSQRLATAKGLNTSANVSAKHFNNQQTVNDYILILAEFGKSALSVHLVQILEIASQCPDEGGEAVFKARSLAAMLGADEVYANADACKEPVKEQKDKNLQTIEIVKVFPNPASNILTISTEGKTMTQLNLTDQLGKVVYSFTTTGKEPFHRRRVNVSTYPTGMYIVTVRLSDGTTESRKVSVLK